MEIYSKVKGLRDVLDDETECRRRYGTDMTKKLKLRLSALRAADSLADFWPPNSGPERCHELKADRAGVFSVNVRQPYRLLFRPVGEQPQQDGSNEQDRWKAVTAIELLTIEDTHG